MATTASAPAATDWKIPPRATWLVLFCCWLGILAEGYDVGVMGAILLNLLDYGPWGLTSIEAGLLSSWALVGMLVGALIIGTLSDLIGRKRMFLLAIVIFTVTQLGAALAPSPEIFGLFRFLGGLGMGGIIPVAAALTIEFSPPHRRSRNYGLMYSAYSLGIVLAALCALLFLSVGGWRLVIGLGCVPVLIVPLLWWLMPDSLDYLISKGRFDEADRQAKKLRIPGYSARDVHQAAPIEQLSPKKVFGALFSIRMLPSTVLFWISLFAGMLLVYGLNTWLPGIMRSAGYDLGSSLTFLLVFSLSSAIGGIVLGDLADRFGKKLILVVFYLLGGLGILLLMLPGNLVISLTFVAFAGIGSISTSLVLTGYVADYYPPNARATATGWALSFARIGAICGPIIGGLIAEAQLGFEWNFITFAIAAVIAAVAVALIPKAPKNL